MADGAGFPFLYLVMFWTVNALTWTLQSHGITSDWKEFWVLEVTTSIFLVYRQVNPTINLQSQYGVKRLPALRIVEWWAADKDKQMRSGGFVMEVGQKWQQLDTPITCFPFTRCTVHLASRPGPRFLVRGGNWLRLKLCGTENEVALWALTQQRHLLYAPYRVPEGPPAEEDHDPPAHSSALQPPSSSSGLILYSSTHSISPAQSQRTQTGLIYLSAPFSTPNASNPVL